MGENSSDVLVACIESATQIMLQAIDKSQGGAITDAAALFLMQQFQVHSYHDVNRLIYALVQSSIKTVEKGNEARNKEK
jgi:hypothetical protein